MIHTIKTSDVRVGMYVIIPRKWLQHPFLKNRFHVSSVEDLKKLHESGIEEVQADTSRSQAALEVASITHLEGPIPEHEKGENNKPALEYMKETVHDPDIRPEVKARVVYHCSRQVMEDLFQNPSAGFISRGKQAVTHIADLIMNDDDTTSHILKIVSHDFTTYTHSVNVGIYGLFLAKRLYGTSSGHDMHELGASFFLHDLGKVKIDPSIINKPDRLSKREMEIMRSHPYQSYKVLEETKHLNHECSVIAMQHHEREDGTGYPRRLKGDEIHDYARICCIADVYDALTARRSYKSAFSPFQSLQIMKEEMLGHFHKDIFENFVMLFA